MSKQVTRRKNLLASYKHWAMPIAAGGVFLALWIVAWGALMGAYAGRMNGVDIAAGGASVNQNVIPGKGRLSVDADIAACVLEHR